MKQRLTNRARAAMLLTETRNTLAQFEDIPFGGYTFTLKELQIELEHALGTAKCDRLVPDFERTDMSTVMRASLPRDIYPHKAVPK